MPNALITRHSALEAPIAPAIGPDLPSLETSGSPGDQRYYFLLSELDRATARNFGPPRSDSAVPWDSDASLPNLERQGDSVIWKSSPAARAAQGRTYVFTDNDTVGRLRAQLERNQQAALLATPPQEALIRRARLAASYAYTGLLVVAAFGSALVQDALQDRQTMAPNIRLMTGLVMDRYTELAGTSGSFGHSALKAIRAAGLGAFQHIRGYVSDRWLLATVFSEAIREDQLRGRQAWLARISLLRHIGK